MTAVPEKVLTWLYSSLKLVRQIHVLLACVLFSQLPTIWPWTDTSFKDYRDPNRTYSDVAKTLSHHASLSPRTQIYTYENGSTALLLQLYGMLHVPFRGNTYKYPITLWIPHGYPRESPMLYVTPTPDIAVRPSQHVSTEGRIFHPYLANWSTHWDKSSLSDFLSIVRDIFSAEPPLISRQQAHQPPPQRFQGSNRPDATQPPPRPPLPTELEQRAPAAPEPAVVGSSASAPALPPKPGAYPRQDSSRQDVSQHYVPNAGTSRGPSLPSKTESATQSRSPQYMNGSGRTAGSIHDPRYIHHQSPPPQLPPSRPESHPLTIAQQSYGTPAPREMSPGYPPAAHSQGFYRAAPTRPPSVPSEITQSGLGGLPSYAAEQRFFNSKAPMPHTQQQQHQRPSNAIPPEIGQSAQAVRRPRAPEVDLLSGPLEVTLPSQTASGQDLPAPPIPRNPEKDAILNAISGALRSQLEVTVAQNGAAVSALQGQNGALQQAYHTMQSELSQLQALDSVLSSNEQILREAMKDADRAMESVERREKPNVDEVLVAPTVVGEQLYGLVADEKSISEAMFLLTRALDRGRISGDVFLKQTRVLAREQFLKKALIRKIARGMGLGAADDYSYY